MENRLSQINLALGFSILTIAALGGAFIATDIEKAYTHHQEALLSWQMTLLRSAHGHTNLFGILHIVFGLTLPFSSLKDRYKSIQTVFLACGTFAMGILLFAKSYPTIGTSPLLSGLIGLLLSLACLTLGSHAFSLWEHAFSTSLHKHKLD